MLPGGWRPDPVSFPQKSCRKAEESPDLGQAKGTVPTHQEEVSGCSKARDGGDRKRSHDRSNPRQKMPPDPRRGHCALDNGTILLSLPTGPPLSIFPAPSPHGLTRSPGKTHLISAYPRKEGAAQPLVCGFGEAHPEATPNSRVQFHLPAFPPHVGFSPWKTAETNKSPSPWGSGRDSPPQE